MNLTQAEKDLKKEKTDTIRFKSQLAEWKLMAETREGDLNVNDGSLTMARREVANQIKEVRMLTQENVNLKTKL